MLIDYQLALGFIPGSGSFVHNSFLDGCCLQTLHILFPELCENYTGYNPLRQVYLIHAIFWELCLELLSCVGCHYIDMFFMFLLLF
jgi:hypothetical protein